MLKLFKRILIRFKCPITCYITAFLFFYFILHITVNYATLSLEYNKGYASNLIDFRIKEVLKKCKGDYAISILALKSNDPRKYLFDKVFFFNKEIQQVRSAKEYNSFYGESHNIDYSTYHLLKEAASGTVITLSASKIDQLPAIKEAAEEANSDIKYIGLIPVKYYNGNIKYVISISVMSDANICTKNNLVRFASKILSKA